MASEYRIQVGDHVRWTDPSMELNVIWEVVGESSKNLHLRFDQERAGRTKTHRRTVCRGDCVLYATYRFPAEAP